MYSELQRTGQFETMSVQTDEDEHSIEMHLPYIAKVMERYGLFKTGCCVICGMENILEMSLRHALLLLQFLFSVDKAISP